MRGNDIQEIATLVRNLYGPALETETTRSSDLLLIRDRSLSPQKSWDYWDRRATSSLSFGSAASGSTSGVPRSLTDGSVGAVHPTTLQGGGLDAVRGLRGERPRRGTDPAISPGTYARVAREAFAEVDVRVGFEAVYELREEIGRGGSSRVHRATRRRDGVDVAVKILDVDSASPAWTPKGS